MTLFASALVNARFLFVSFAVALGPPALRAGGDSYTPSPVIKTIRWAPKATIIRKAKGSDCWPVTWADDGFLYTAYGDGNGFEPFVPRKLSLGLARVTGSPPNFAGENLRSPSIEQIGDGKAGKKPSGLLMVDSVLYLLVRNAANSQIAWSADHGANWRWCGWKFTSSFGCPTFLNFGPNYRGARDGYVYIYSPDSTSAYKPADRFVLARTPAKAIKDQNTYEFLREIDGSGQPRWTSSVSERGAVFSNPGQCYRSSVSYDAGLKRYLWCQTLPGGDGRFRGGLAIYDAPEPWGPWTVVYQNADWDVAPGETSSFPTKWMSADGTELYLVFSGEDSFSVRRATLLKN